MANTRSRQTRLRRIYARSVVAGALLLVLQSSASATTELTIYVSPTGDDSLTGLTRHRHGPQWPTGDTRRGAGSRSSASTAVNCGAPSQGMFGCRQIRASNHFRTTARDSGTADAPITYAVCEGSAALVGGHELHGFKPVSDATILTQLDNRAQDHVWHLNVKAAGVGDLGQLYSSGRQSHDSVHSPGFAFQREPDATRTLAESRLGPHYISHQGGDQRKVRLRFSKAREMEGCARRLGIRLLDLGLGQTPMHRFSPSIPRAER